MSDKKSNPGKGKRNNKPALSSSSETRASDAAKRAASDTIRSDNERSSHTTSTTTHTAGRNAGGGGTTTHVTRTDGGSSRGWVAPAALLFGLLGTGLSAYLWSQLKSLGESTTTQFQSQAEATKTSVAGLKTELDEKTASLSSTLDEKTGELSTALEEKTGAINSALEEKTAALSSEVEEKTAALSTTLEEKTSELGSSMASSNEELKAEVTAGKEEVATNTASAMQEFTSKTETEINNVSTSFNTGLALLRERHTEKFSELDEKMNQLDESVQTTNELASRGQRDWVLAEVNYLLRTGVHRVKLAGDVKAGVIALESASDRLHTLGDINYMPVREQIAEEVAALRQVGPPDIEGLIFKLQHMSKRADTLPLPKTDKEKAKEENADDPVASTRALGSSLLNKLKGSVSIGPSEGTAGTSESATKPRKSEKPTEAQLSASDALRLHLQAARLSALRHDSENFTTHMDNAINYSKEIFDQDSDQVKTYLTDLSEIRETPIVPKTPALGSSLSLFSKIDAKRGEN